jgi:hypothetical protein
VLFVAVVKLNVVVEALAGTAASIAPPRIANPRKFLIKPPPWFSSEPFLLEL